MKTASLTADQIQQRLISIEAERDEHSRLAEMHKRASFECEGRAAVWRELLALANTSNSSPENEGNTP